MNQYYIDQLRMHTSKAKKERSRQGLYNAPIAPYGYQHPVDSKTPPTINETEALPEILDSVYQRLTPGGVWYLIETSPQDMPAHWLYLYCSGQIRSAALIW